MLNIRTFTSAILVMLFLTACGASGQPGAGAPTVAGTLLIDTGNHLAVLPLSTHRQWGSSIPLGASRLAAIDGEGRLQLAQFTFAEPFTVQPIDPVTLTATGPAFEWPDSSIASRMRSLSFSPDGSWAAAVISTVGEQQLHVIRLGAQPTTHFVGFSGRVGSSTAWLDDHHLAFVLDVSDQNGTEDHGLIAAVDVRTLQAGQTQLELLPIVSFTGADWDVRSVHSLTVNSDRSQLLWSLYGQLWRKDTPLMRGEPHQLTTGTGNHSGAVFSPDSSMVAFIDYVPEYVSPLYVIPNHRTAPIDPSSES